MEEDIQVEKSHRIIDGSCNFCPNSTTVYVIRGNSLQFRLCLNCFVIIRKKINNFSK